jgi:phosphomannomutase
MSDNPVRFGTDGWRAIIADTFTFRNVRACAKATAEHFAGTHGRERHVVIGFDTRFLSDQFAAAAAEVVAAAGFRVELADRPAPTPAISQRIVSSGACGGIVITSSHNPYQWNGVKVKPYYGGSASPEVVADIEGRIPAILTSGSSEGGTAPEGSIERFDPIPGYLAALAEQVDVDRIRQAGLRVAIDPMFGTGMGLFTQLLAGGATTVTEIHAERNPAFPGIRAPEPIDSNLGELMAMVAGSDYDVGIATDGDADRVGLVAEDGTYVDQLRTFGLLVHYFLGERGLRGPIVKSVTTTDMARTLAEHYGVPFYETPVGFKYIGPLMMEKDALIGGEESGGYGFRGHLPERDGILSGLFLLDYMAATGKPVSGLLTDLFAVAGEHHYRRIDIDLPAGASDWVRARLESVAPAAIAGCTVRQRDTTDGWRFVIDEGWLLFRLSGTEPLLRIYTEVRDKRLVEPLLAAGKMLAGVTE